jgi:hypothetical protein
MGAHPEILSPLTEAVPPPQDDSNNHGVSMKHLRLAAWMALGAVTGSAGEAGILASKLVGQAQTAATGGRYEDASPTAKGFRVGWSLLNLKAVELSVNATYHPKATADLKLEGTRIGTYGVEYAAVGAQFDFKFLVNLNVGAEVRQERLSWDLGAQDKAETTQSRPWFRAGLGFSIPSPFLQPFARIEVALPASKEEDTGTTAEIRKALAPRAQFGVYVGTRF